MIALLHPAPQPRRAAPAPLIRWRAQLRQLLLQLRILGNKARIFRLKLGYARIAFRELFRDLGLALLTCFLRCLGPFAGKTGAEVEADLNKVFQPTHAAKPAAPKDGGQAR